MSLVFDNTEVYNMLNAVRAVRYSYSSEEKSDSRYEYRVETFPRPDASTLQEEMADGGLLTAKPYIVVGDADRRLIRTLINGGPSHRKFMRQILVSTDIIAPRYWWTQFDTYKVGTVAMSESTMHTLMSSPITKDAFSFAEWEEAEQALLVQLEALREAGDFRRLVSLLPQSYRQKRMVTLNYEVILNVLEQRRGHKLSEWRDFQGWAMSLDEAGLFFGHLCGDG